VKAAGGGQFGEALELVKKFRPHPLPADDGRLGLALSHAKLLFCRQVAAATESWPFASLRKGLPAWKMRSQLWYSHFLAGD
jgi:hypothetical protein